MLWCAMIAAGVLPSVACADDDVSAKREQALRLCDEFKFIEALPLLESVAADRPDDRLVQERLANALVTNAATLDDAKARQKVLARARGILARLKESGQIGDLSQILLDTIPPDGHFPPLARKDVEQALREGETAFVKGDFDKALAAYQRVLILDPNFYEAALFSGDVYFRKKDVDEAGKWFGRAVAIDPNRETAYRFWADALMKAGRMDEARSKIIDAIVAQPYTRGPWLALNYWARENRAPVGHPTVQPPEGIGFQGDQEGVRVDAKLLEKTDGTQHWALYFTDRVVWKKGKSALEFPDQKQYRHSLREETEALRKVAEAAQQDLKDGKVKKLDDSVSNLIKLNDDGLLEAYVLLARPDDGIAQDYDAYRKDHRAELRRYLSEAVIRPLESKTRVRTPQRPGSI